MHEEHEKKKRRYGEINIYVTISNPYTIYTIQTDNNRKRIPDIRVVKKNADTFRGNI